MDYQKKLLTEEQIQNIYVAEGDIVSFFNADGKFCTKDQNGKITIIEDKLSELEQKFEQFKEVNKTSEEIIVEIDGIIGEETIVSEEEQASNDLLSVL